ncbi:hypothetical protein FACS1894103_5570 [Campylobacterota bacterium]|nr:hypothetical protein FACS1894103_5570 [Campylobacterota bacterium]
MFENVRVPQRIENSPIQEAVFEIRYASKFPGDALYGLLYDVIGGTTPSRIIDTQIRQIPPNLLENNIGIKYQPYYNVTFDNSLTFSFGPYSMIFSSPRPYVGWDKWSNFFKAILSKIQEKGIVQQVERVGIRYLDIFDDNIFEHINARLVVESDSITNIPTSFHTQFDQSDIHIILNVGNVANININGVPAQKSLIDIDCIYDFNNSSPNEFFESYLEVLERIHTSNKKVFFGLLKQEFLDTFNPEYAQ